jgi:hypothetical protein
MAREGGEDDLDRSVGIRAPRCVDGKWTGSGTSTEPVADHCPVQPERRTSARLVIRPGPAGEQRTVRQTHRREVEYESQVKCQAGAPRMVSAGGIDEECVRGLFERTDGRLEGRALTKGEEARQIRSPGLALDDDGGLGSCRRAPQGITRGPRAVLSPRRAHEAPTDQRVIVDPPRRRVHLGKFPLEIDELTGRGRPGRHGGRIVP